MTYDYNNDNNTMYFFYNFTRTTKQLGNGPRSYLLWQLLRLTMIDLNPLSSVYSRYVFCHSNKYLSPIRLLASLINS